MEFSHRTSLENDVPCRGWIVCVLALLLICSGGPAGRAQTTHPENLDGDAQRLTFLGNQLSADEAAIAAINKQLTDE